MENEIIIRETLQENCIFFFRGQKLDKEKLFYLIAMKKNISCYVKYEHESFVISLRSDIDVLHLKFCTYDKNIKRAKKDLLRLLQGIQKVKKHRLIAKQEAFYF